jgi:CRP-like cAMP-binding protein
MREESVAEPADIESVFLAGERGWSLEATREARALLLRHRTTLKTLTARNADPLFRTALPLGTLYWVLEGRISVQWESETDRQVALVTAYQGDVFNEVQCPLGGRPAVGMGLYGTPVTSRTCRTTRVLEVPTNLVDRLVQCPAVDRWLANIALNRTRFALTRLAIERLYEPVFVVALLCISPSCGIEQSLHPEVRCLGAPVTVRKTITFAELRRHTGFAYGTVRAALAMLSRAGYIGISSNTRSATHVTIPNAQRLARAIEERDLTSAA